VADAAVMKSELAALGITGGLVRNAISAEWHPTVGNPELSHALAGCAGFEPVWVVLPHWTGEFPEPSTLARELSGSRVRAVAMYPRQHGFAVRQSVTGPLFEMLQSRRSVLFVALEEADLACVEGIATDFPSLPIVVSDTSYRLVRELYPVFVKCPNVRIEISGYMLHRGIEDICNKFGPERLLFGSRYPTFNPGCAVASVMYAAVPDDAKEMIASGNARKLLAQVRL